jgi:NAD(P)-dependent dehydrogenase (short-subunit alcohol dehydrogenase family)
MDRVVDVNLKGVDHGAARSVLAAGRTGSSTSSQAGKRLPMLGVYCAAKAGVILLTQVLAQGSGRRHHGQHSLPRHGGRDLLNKDRG